MLVPLVDQIVVVLFADTQVGAIEIANFYFGEVELLAGGNTGGRVAWDGCDGCWGHCLLGGLTLKSIDILIAIIIEESGCLGPRLVESAVLGRVAGLVLVVVIGDLGLREGHGKVDDTSVGLVCEIVAEAARLVEKSTVACVIQASLVGSVEKLRSRTNTEAGPVGEVGSCITGQAERGIGAEQAVRRARQAGLGLVKVVPYGVVVGVETKNALAGRQDSIQHQIQIGIASQAQSAIGGTSLTRKACDTGIVISERIVVARLTIA